MTISKYQVRRGAYYDSVVLMQLQRALLALPGVRGRRRGHGDAGQPRAAGGQRSAARSGRGQPGRSADRGQGRERRGGQRDALAQVDALLARRRVTDRAGLPAPQPATPPPSQLPEAGWVLISVPGRYAAGVAREALDLDQHVFLYSDNVSLEDEIALKQDRAIQGSARHGAGLRHGDHQRHRSGLRQPGPARRHRAGGRVRHRPAGGDRRTSTSLGGGISQAIGTGGRDLKSAVGAITAHQALDVLARDPETKVIVLISKPPSPEVATGLLAAAQATGKPVVVDFIGYPPPARRLGNLHFSTSAEEAARPRGRARKVGGRQPVPSPSHRISTSRPVLRRHAGLRDAARASDSSLARSTPTRPSREEQQLAGSAQEPGPYASSTWAMNSSPSGGCTR